MKRFLLIGILLTGLIAAEVLFYHAGHHATWFEKIPGFFTLLGLAGGILLMAFAKSLGHFILHRKESYYDDAAGS